MDNIINPWFIYFINLIDNFLVAVFFAGVVCAGLILVYWVGRLYIADATWKSKEEIKEWNKNWKHTNKRAYLGLILCVLISTFAPDKNTIIDMYIADQITWNRVEKIGKMGKDFKNEIKKDIIDIVNSFNSSKQGGL